MIWGDVLATEKLDRVGEVVAMEKEGKVGKVVATEWVGTMACKYGVVESTKNIDVYIKIYPIMILLSFN